MSLLLVPSPAIVIWLVPGGGNPNAEPIATTYGHGIRDQHDRGHHHRPANNRRRPRGAKRQRAVDGARGWASPGRPLCIARLLDESQLWAFVYAAAAGHAAGRARAPLHPWRVRHHRRE